MGLISFCEKNKFEVFSMANSSLRIADSDLQQQLAIGFHTALKNEIHFLHYTGVQNHIL